MNLDMFSAELAHYSAPLALALFIISSAYVYNRTRTWAALSFGMGAFMALLNIVMQYFFPTFSVQFNEAGEMISSQGPTIETYIYSIVGSIGFLICSISFIFIAKSYVSAKNT